MVDYGGPESHVIVLTTWNHLIVTAKFPVEVFVIVSGPNVRLIYDYSAGFAIAMALQCPQIWLRSIGASRALQLMDLQSSGRHGMNIVDNSSAGSLRMGESNALCSSKQR